MRELRIAISGAPGTGKTELARALAGDLGVPYLAEEMRAHLERTGRPLTALPADEIERVLVALWRERAASERALAGFVADNSALDFAAYAVYYDCLAEPAPDEPRRDEPELLAGPRAHLARYDAIFVLPCGVLPYVRDGVRPDSRAAQLRHHLIIDGMLRRHGDPDRVHHVPPACVDLDERRAHVRAVLARRGAPVCRPGTVYLVGAGPGDPGLVTLRARALLAAADVIAHDALVPPAILALARPGAELVPVGRRHGSGPTAYRLHPDVLTRAARGQIVVRLKAGDPMIFGRGGEEAADLAAAGLAFEIVPGVSAALGAAAYAGIPLTHRDHASDVAFLSGHDASGGYPSHTDWAAAARGTGTLVLFMASKSLAGNLARLVAGGRSPETPAAYIAAATRPDQQVVTGTLATLAARVTGVDPDAPALVIAGEVVALHHQLAWFAHGRDAAAAAANSSPAAANPSPAAATPSPAAANPSPAAANPSPAAANPSPAAATPSPAAASAPPGAAQGAVDRAQNTVPGAADRPVPRPGARGLVLVYTGHGKGKTTAALGLVFRALGRGMRAAVVQFIKGKWKTGERLFAETLPGLTFLVMGRGFTWNSDDLSRDRAAAQAAWAEARRLLTAGAHAVVVLDEITYAIHYGFVDLADVLAALRDRPPHVHVVITGRNAPEALCDAADLVTDMAAVKHPFTHGVPAQLGVDY